MMGRTVSRTVLWGPIMGSGNGAGIWAPAFAGEQLRTYPFSHTKTP
jgi:hypothetical protein